MRKSSSPQIFFILKVTSANKLVMSEMQKKIGKNWGHQLRFRDIALEEYLDFEKLGLRKAKRSP